MILEGLFELLLLSNFHWCFLFSPLVFHCYFLVHNSLFFLLVIDFLVRLLHLDIFWPLSQFHYVVVRLFPCILWFYLGTTYFLWIFLQMLATLNLVYLGIFSSALCCRKGLLEFSIVPWCLHYFWGFFPLSSCSAVVKHILLDDYADSSNGYW